MIRDRLERMFRERTGVGEVRIITEHWDQADLRDPRVLPLIHYGVLGVNLFQHHENCYCLNGFYASKENLEAQTNDSLPPEEQGRFEITPERAVRAGRGRSQREGEAALYMIERGVVEQAVARCRHTIYPQTVFTFQKRGLGYPDTVEFSSLAEARAHFKIPTWRERRWRRQGGLIRDLRARGRTHREAAKAVGLTERSGYRLLRRLGDDMDSGLAGCAEPQA